MPLVMVCMGDLPCLS